MTHSYSNYKYLSSQDTTHTIYYRGHWLRVRNGRGSDLEIRYFSSSPKKCCDWHSFYSVVARNNDILKKLVLEAKRGYEKDAEYRIHIYVADS